MTREEPMTQSMAAFLRWTPRVLAVAAAAFIGVFSLDVFNEGLDVLHTLAALAMHLIPTAIVLGMLAIAWRYPRAGGALFVVAGVAYALRAGGRLSWIVVVAAPLLLVGTLFLLSGFADRVGQRRPSPQNPGLA